MLVLGTWAILNIHRTGISRTSKAVSISVVSVSVSLCQFDTTVQDVAKMLVFS